MTILPLYIIWRILLMNGRMDDGSVYLCTLTDRSLPGEKSREVLTKVARHWYEEMLVSFRRQYAAKGVNEQIDMLIRIHFDKRARIGMFAVLGNGDQYEITNVTSGTDPETRLRYTEVSLSRMENFYDLETE